MFQRQTRLTGDVLVRGRVNVNCDAIEACLTGKSLQGPLDGRWQTLASRPPRGDFQAKLPTTAGGWYRLETRLVQGGNVLAQCEVKHVGLGEVFVVVGQSNAANHGETKQRPNVRPCGVGGQFQMADRQRSAAGRQRRRRKLRSRIR